MSRPRRFRAWMSTNTNLTCGFCGKLGRHMVLNYRIAEKDGDGRTVFGTRELSLCAECSNDLMNAMVRAVTKTDTEALRIRHDGLDGDV